MRSKLVGIIISISVLIPLVVAFLLFFPKKMNFGDWVYYLPHINAILNSTTSILLILALIAIRQKRIELHRLLMFESLVLGALFLISYVIYHGSVDSTIYGDSNHNGILSSVEVTEIGSARIYYIILLLSHIAMSVVVVPFVLFAFYYALSGQFEKHKKVVRFTFPIWLFVSISGVVVYLMIRPFYII